MQAVFNAPVISQRFAVDLSGGLTTADKVGNLCAHLVVTNALATAHTDHTHPAPTPHVESRRVGDDIVATRLLPAMTAFCRFIMIVLQAGKIVLQRFLESGLNGGGQPRLGVLDGPGQT